MTREERIIAVIIILVISLIAGIAMVYLIRAIEEWLELVRINLEEEFRQKLFPALPPFITFATIFLYTRSCSDCGSDTEDYYIDCSCGRTVCGTCYSRNGHSRH